MNRKNVYILLIVTAVCSAAFALFADAGNVLLAALQFPFAQIGDLLRWLSLSGFIGNMAAWGIYLLLCAVPSMYYLWLYRNKNTEKIDSLLILLTAVLAVVLYKMVNPYSSFLSASDMWLQMVKAQYGAVVYVTLIGWLILRTVKNFFDANEQTLYQALAVFLKLLGMLFVMAAFGGCFGELLSSIESIRSGNQNSGNLNLTYLFAIAHCLVDALPYLLNTVAVIMAMELLDAFRSNSEHTAAYAERLAKWCGTTLTCTAVAGISFHVVQMLFLSNLRSMDASVSLPVSSIAFLLICLIAARIIAENKALRDDNDLFI